jgi:hypothetical protein
VVSAPGLSLTGKGYSPVWGEHRKITDSVDPKLIRYSLRAIAAFAKNDAVSRCVMATLSSRLGGQFSFSVSASALNEARMS